MLFIGSGWPSFPIFKNAFRKNDKRNKNEIRKLAGEIRLQKQIGKKNKNDICLRKRNKKKLKKN